MEFNNSDTPRSLGRGRARERNDLRRPLAYTYAGDTPEFVPTEGGGNGIRLNSSVGDTAWLDESQKGEAVIPAVPSGDQIHPALSRNTSSGISTQSSGQEKGTSTLSPYAKEFVPRNFRPEPRVPPTQMSEDVSIDTNSDSYPIQELRHFLYEITLSPGKFERRVQPLTAALNTVGVDDDTLRAIVNIIFDESVRQPNFRYSGARLCKYLSNELGVTTDRGNFRSLLLQRCCQEHKRREYLAQADDGGIYLRGFAMFLAELFSHLEISNQRIVILGENLPLLMETLLSYPSPDNLKCICQILKLVGIYLEDFERSKIANAGASPEMEKIMCSLKDVTLSPDYSRDIREMVLNVVELRACDWGRVASTPVVHSEPVMPDTTPPPPLNEPVMYGPDGKPITPEESLFLHSQYGCHSTDTEEYDVYEETTYDEMEEEIEEAYELFLREHEMSR